MQIRIVAVCIVSYLSFVLGEADEPPIVYSCSTPYIKAGICTSELDKCPNLKNFLATKTKEEAASFLEISRCSGTTPNGVCCPSQPINFDHPARVGCASSERLPDPRSGCCGIDASAADKVFRGEMALIDQYPWLALIEYTKDNKTKLLCGGALISGRYVVTAAHCVNGQALRFGTPSNVRLGEYDTTNDPKEIDCVPAAGSGIDCTTGATVIPIEKIIPHEEYDPKLVGKHDIALLKLSQLAPYSDFIRPICLPQKDITAERNSKITFALAGWEAIKSTYKKQAFLPYRTQDDCQKSYNGTAKVTIWKNQLCAGGEPNKNVCKSDAGGPLMYEYTDPDTRNRVHEIVGITVLGPKICGSGDKLEVYTKVFEYLPWIKKTVETG